MKFLTKGGVIYPPFKTKLNKMNIQRILVPVDYSECSTQALKYAVSFAKKAQAKVVVLHAYHMPVPVAEMTVTIDNSVIEELEHEAHDQMTRLVDGLPSLKEVLQSTEVILSLALDAIDTAIEEHGIDLIIMGTTGANSLGDKVLGTNTYGVIKRATCPILAIPESYHGTDITQVVFACDYRKMNDLKAMDPLTAISQKYDMHLHLLHIDEHQQPIDGKELFEGKKIDQYLKKVEHSFHVSKEKHTEEAIQKYIDDHEIDLLAVMPRKHSFFEGLTHKSFTKQMAHHSKVPLLVLHDNFADVES